MTQAFRVLLELDCDGVGCDRTNQHSAATRLIAMEEANRAGWILSSNGKAWCCHECFDSRGKRRYRSRKGAACRR